MYVHWCSTVTDWIQRRVCVRRDSLQLVTWLARGVAAAIHEVYWGMQTMTTQMAWAAGAVFALGGALGLAKAETTAQILPQTMDMLSHAISVQTYHGNGQVPKLANYFADKLKAGGFPAADVQVIRVGETAALIARIHGTDNGKPIVATGHMDVVPANPKDWQRDPFKMVQEDGYIFGRGVADMKTSTVALVQTFIRLKQEDFKPRRDLVLALSGDEERDELSTRELAKHFPDADYVLIAEGGGGTIDPTTGKPSLFEVQAAEKTYADFQVTYTSPGGHSSEPSQDNAIYHLAKAIDRIAAYRFPPMSNEITRASLAALGERTPGAIGGAMQAFARNPKDANAAAVIAGDPAYVGQIGTTCVATMLAAGHAPNALPQSATATINCRIFPDTTAAQVRDTLVKVIDDPKAEISAARPPLGPSSSPIREDVMDAVARAVHQRYPKLDVVPSMAAYATDGKVYRAAGIPTYGIAAQFTKPNDTFMHGLNERLPVSEVAASLDYWHSLLKDVGSK